MNPPETTGLIVRDASATIPLESVEVRSRVLGTLSRVSVIQRYENREKVPLEAVYVFPLEEGSAVCRFAVTIDDRRIEGRVRPRDEAFDEYDEAMAEGHGAFLLDQERPNVFTASVGNVLPGQTVAVEITYVAELETTADAVRLLIPTTVSPRYVPEHRRNHEGLTDAERVSPPISIEGVPYRLTLEVEADLLSPIREIESPSHKIRTELDGPRAKVTLAGDEGALDRDFVLLLRAAEPHRPRTCFARDAEGDRFALVTLTPDIPADRTPLEVVFVVDCSGSMGGTSIEEARRTLLLCLHSLQPGDRFNVVRFGSTHETLFPEPVAYDDKTLAKARKRVERMDADLGGTEILRPLTEVLEAARVEKLPRRVVLLTDGQVSNEADVIALARRHRAATRVFSFGIGAGVSEHLVRGVARASGGAAEFVHPGEAVEDKVMRHFERITLSAATEMRIAWEGFDVADVTPAEIPALAPGEPVSFLARVEAGTEGRAVLEGRGPAGKFRLEATIAEGPPDPEADATVPTLWARRRIREIEEGGAGYRGSRQSNRKRKKTEAELVRLGTRYGLMSSATSYVVIEERAEGERATERAELRRIPVALTRGWGGMAGRVDLQGFIGSPAPASMDDTGACFAEFAMPASPPTRARKSVMRSLGNAVAGSGKVLRGVIRRDQLRAPETSRTFGLLSSQGANGSWSLEREVATACSADLGKLRKAAKDLALKDADRIVATLTVLTHLEDEGVPAAWRPVLKKAEAWLEKALGDATPPSPHGDWKSWARSLRN